jgi:hypothetical protein
MARHADLKGLGFGFDDRWLFFSETWYDSGLHDTFSF